MAVIVEIPVRKVVVKFDGVQTEVLEFTDAMWTLKEEGGTTYDNSYVSVITNPFVELLNAEATAQGQGLAPDKVYLRIVAGGPGGNPGQDDNGPSLNSDLFQV